MGHRLSKIVTRTGDTGTSGLADGSRLPKWDLRFEAMGDVDELNSHLGVLLTLNLPQELATVLLDVQQRLFDIGGELAMPEYHAIREEHLATLDAALEQFNASLPPLKEFILPGGSPAAAQAHLARAVARRAERALWRTHENTPLQHTFSLRFLNRLSDLLFVMARVLGRSAGAAESTWQKRGG
ncbi:cob(I)yrinic acid a,c-diamide adenosyltransferase [Sinimarinibacterium sp. CAU 1509]|uniref:cob(I)yrinic acid a,c-diamide adenosyltransferase n=1 Tax=Sinimarinibacterium sp. CAU 1509 TaxID=2562283 RepID=UPI0010AB6AC0|nr:cob(I)yrinic acid a,c-diamide adenosyltransferase [Sinimarinibacterium sp. CAU 1509]TJY64849.1 cob(I)yrinic acid a,c-diamide adenosyltransferase [Sinimarinibacterium sp. CAU 1509]